MEAGSPAALRAVALIKPAVAKLSVDDMISLAADLASREPWGAPLHYAMPPSADARARRRRRTPAMSFAAHEWELPR